MTKSTSVTTTNRIQEQLMVCVIRHCPHRRRLHTTSQQMNNVQSSYILTGLNQYYALELSSNAVVTCEIKQWNDFKIISKLDSLRWFSRRRSPPPHFWGCAPRGLWPPNSNSAEIFVQCIYPHTSSYVYSFGSYHVDKQTNKQTDAAENSQRSSLCYGVG